MRIPLILLLSASFIAQPVLAAGCDIPPVWRPQADSIPTLSIATMLRGGRRDAPVGSATIIDKRRRLLVTASHVVEGDTAWFRFPGFDSEVFSGVVLLRIPEADGADEENGKSWGRARDIAVIQASTDLPEIAQALDLRILTTTNEKLTFYGFPGGTKTALSGTGDAAVPQIPGSMMSDEAVACTRAIRETTLGGDSGSAIISESAFVVGVAAQSWQRDKLNMFVPTGCFFDQIISKIGASDADMAIRTFMTKSPAAIAGILSADPEKSGISNLDIYIAARQLLEAGEGTDKLRCPIMPMATARGIPLEGLVMSARLPAQKIAIADTLVGSVARSIKVLQAREARIRLQLALTLYRFELGSKLTKAYTSLVEVQDQLTPADAVILKSAADASLMLAQFLDDRAALLSLAQRSAALAVAAAKGASLRGAALASLGQASTGFDEDLAMQAFHSAQAEGFSPRWVGSLRADLREGTANNLQSRYLSNERLGTLVAAPLNSGSPY